VAELDSGDVPNPLLRDEDVRSLLAVPFSLEGGLAGVLQVGTLSERSFTKEDGDLLQLVADRAALAIEHSLLYEREHSLVEAFQRNLLPERLPQPPGVELAARYLPGGRRAEVGGDWYDAIPLEDGRIGLAIGDVVGHGLEAAALMGRLRNALRAYAHEGHSPAAALRHLDRMVQDLEPGRTATIVYLVIAEDASSVCYAIAGHPPPLVVGPEGDARFLEGGRSVPIGVLPDTTYREHRCALPAGAALLLYTDGLVERRDAGLDDGLERLRDAVGAAHADPNSLCDRAVSAMLGDAPADDDVAMLVLRNTPIGGDRLALAIPADPKELRRLRSTLGQWLEVAGADTEEIRAIQLACHEACSNVIEHAYRFGEDQLEVEAALREGEVAITIRDRGGWREPRESNRGRGLPLIEGLMDEVEVSPGRSGTTVVMRRRLGAPAAAEPAAPAPSG
jgi:serine phosphatase RsbU (regulator of sigma subunit)/anti-sigma regulatory factor (Ser/Thr protein kinase)